MSNEPIMSFEPDQGGISAMPPAYQWFPPQEGMCTPNNPEGATGAAEQNMSYNTPDGKPPAAVWGYSSSFFTDPTMSCTTGSGAPGVMGFGGTCVDNAMNPHALGNSTSGNLLQVLLSGPGGYVDADEIEIMEDQFAAIEWWAVGAKYLHINGTAMGNIGRIGAPYESGLVDEAASTRTYEIAATFPDGAEEKRKIGVKMVRSAIEGAQEIKIEISGDWLNSCLTKVGKRLSAGWRYVELEEIKFAIEVAGKVGKSATWNGTISHAFSKNSIQEGVAGALTGSLQLDSEWTMEASLKASGARGLKFEKGISFTAEAKVAAEIVFQKKVGNSTWAFSLEVTVGVYEFSWELGGELKGDWPMTVEIAGGVAYNGPWSIREFAFDGSVKGVLSAKLAPKWKMIAVDVGRAFAPELLSLGALAAPIAIGGIAIVACVVVSGAMWKIVCDAHEVSDREREITKIADAYWMGFSYALCGGDPNKASSETTITVGNANAVGIGRGAALRRDKIREYTDYYGGTFDRVGFEEWLVQSIKKEGEQARGTIRYSLLSDAFLEFAKPLEGTGWTKLNQKRDIWDALFGGRPPIKSTQDYALWMKVKTTDPDHPKITNGDW